MAEGSGLGFLNEKFLKTAVELVQKLCGVIFAICALILALPAVLAKPLGIVAMRDTYRQWIGLALIISGVFFCSNYLREHKRQRDRRKYEGKILDRLSACSEDELNLLGMFLARNSQSITIDPIENPEAVAIADHLTTKRLLIHTPGSMTIHMFSYSMPDFVWKHIQENVSLAARE